MNSAEAYSATSSVSDVEIAKDCRPVSDRVLSNAPASDRFGGPTWQKP
jgi:hypothetical protein